MHSLENYGWNSFHHEFYNKNQNNALLPARITTENKNNFFLFCEHGEILGELSGKLMFNTDNPAELPKTGDWVLINYFDKFSPAIIQEVLPRKTKISRKVRGIRSVEQVIAANVDIIFIVQSLDLTFNLNRIERYVVIANESGGRPVIVLSKSDLCDDIEEKVASVKKISHSCDVISISSYNNAGLEKISNYINASETIALIGPSGAGKSTLINKLIGEDIIPVQEVRSADRKGKHTTTKRELILLPSGGLIIDTPGMRELQLWTDDDNLKSVYSEFDEYSTDCRYDDCTHTHETGCAVKVAVEKNLIPESSYQNYLKMLKEIKYLETRTDLGKKLNSKKRWKIIHKEIKRLKKNNDKF